MDERGQWACALALGAREGEVVCECGRVGASLVVRAVAGCARQNEGGGRIVGARDGCGVLLGVADSGGEGGRAA